MFKVDSAKTISFITSSDTYSEVDIVCRRSAGIKSIQLQNKNKDDAPKPEIEVIDLTSDSDDDTDVDDSDDDSLSSTTTTSDVESSYSTESNTYSTDLEDCHSSGLGNNSSLEIFFA